MDKQRRLGDRRKTQRRKSVEIVDGYPFIAQPVKAPAAWPFPVISDQIRCGHCGTTFRNGGRCVNPQCSGPKA